MFALAYFFAVLALGVLGVFPANPSGAFLLCLVLLCPCFVWAINAALGRGIDPTWQQRYLIGAALIATAISLMSLSKTPEWMPIVATAAACLVMFELLFIGVLCGCLYLTFAGLASLPVGAAIIAGAFIIASAARQQNG